MVLSNRKAVSYLVFSNFLHQHKRNLACGHSPFPATKKIGSQPCLYPPIPVFLSKSIISSLLYSKCYKLYEHIIILVNSILLYTTTCFTNIYFTIDFKLWKESKNQTLYKNIKRCSNKR